MRDGGTGGGAPDSSEDMPPQRISFESTIEERVEAHMRLYQLTGMLRRQLMLPLVIAPAGGLACFFILQGTAEWRLFFAILFALAFSAIHLAFYKQELRRQVRRMLARQLGTSLPVPSEYELSNRGVTFRQGGMEITFRWGSVREVLDAGDAIEVIVHPTGISRIPKRVFRDAAEERAWLEYARACSRR